MTQPMPSRIIFSNEGAATDPEAEQAYHLIFPLQPIQHLPHGKASPQFIQPAFFPSADGYDGIAEPGIPIPAVGVFERNDDDAQVREIAVEGPDE